MKQIKRYVSLLKLQGVTFMAATVKDIARETGLGLATISKYMNGGNVLEKNRILIENAIETLDYKVNRFARGLKTNKSMIIGVVIPGIKSIFNTTIIATIEDKLRKLGYGVIVCDSRGDTKLEKELMEFLITLSVDGIVTIPIGTTPEHLMPLRKSELPIVVMDGFIEGICCDSVLTDNFSGAYQAVDYLMKRGHRNIGIVTGNMEIYTSVERLAGYEKALRDNGVDVNKDYIINTDFTMGGGYEGAKKIIETYPEITAIFTVNYYLTIGAYMVINEKGIKVPTDLSIVGFDKFDLSGVIRPELTVISQSIDKMAEKAAELLMVRLQEGQCTEETMQKIVFPTVFCEGNSVKDIR